MAPNIGLLKAPGNGFFYLTSRAGFLSAEMKIDAGGPSIALSLSSQLFPRLGTPAFKVLGKEEWRPCLLEMSMVAIVNDMVSCFRENRVLLWRSVP